MQTEAKAVREILAQDPVEFSGDSIYEWGPVFKASVGMGGSMPLRPQEKTLVCSIRPRPLSTAPPYPISSDHGSPESIDGASIAARWAAELNVFHEETLPMIRDAGLPSYAVSLDFRAFNLIYTGTNELPVFIDFENGKVAPRLLDLAFSVLLFASESEHNLGRLFTAEEWFVYLDAYQQTAPQLTTQEVQLWPEALRYMRLEWGTWQITESAEWDLPGQTGFLLDLLKLDGKQRFPLTQNKHATRAGADFPGS